MLHTTTTSTLIPGVSNTLLVIFIVVAAAYFFMMYRAKQRKKMRVQDSEKKQEPNIAQAPVQYSLDSFDNFLNAAFKVLCVGVVVLFIMKLVFKMN